MRTFFCVELDEAVKQRLEALSRPLKRTAARVRWVAPPLLHLTLKFLGEIDPTHTPALQEVAQAAAEGYRPFSLTLDRLGTFPGPQHPRVVWVGCQRPEGPLVDLQQALDRALAALDFPRERHYTPHVTLGRVRESEPQALERLRRRLERTEVPPLEVEIRALTLMESVLKPGGPTYLPLFRVALGG